MIQGVEGDRITSDGAIAGAVTDASAIAELHISLDEGRTFTDILADVQPDGRFSLSQQRLLQLNGGTLPDGSYTAILAATDAAGNSANPVEVTFTLDRLAPTATLVTSLNTGAQVLELEFNEAVTAQVFTASSYQIAVVGEETLIPIVSVDKLSDTRVQLTVDPLDSGDYELSIAAGIVDQAGNATAVAQRLAFSLVEPVPVSISPFDGEELVTLTRETIVRFGKRVDPATVTGESFYAIANGERLTGTIRVSSTEEFATLFYDQPLPQSTEVRVVVDGDRIRRRDGAALDADNDGVAGGKATAYFRTLPLTRIPNTDVFGYVYDSYNTDSNGDDIPLEGVVIRLDSLPDVFAVTDENGYFILEDVPAPDFYVYIDGSDVTNAPEGVSYASLGKAFHSVPGQAVQLEMDGEPFDVYLPTMAAANVVALSTTEATDVRFGPESLDFLQQEFPDVDPTLWQEATVTFAPGSAQDDEGTAATQAMIVPVNPQRLPAPLPPNMNPGLVISIQAGSDAGFNRDSQGGATNFDIPAPVSFPNTDELAPGEKSLIWSFDHDAGDWVVIGTGTVSDDGRAIVSDEGVGVLAPGWHFTQPGVTATGGGVGNLTEQEGDAPGQECEKGFWDKVREGANLALSVGKLIAEFIPISNAVKCFLNLTDSYNQVLNDLNSLIQRSRSGAGVSCVSLGLVESLVEKAVTTALACIPGGKVADRLDDIVEKLSAILGVAADGTELISCGPSKTSVWFQRGKDLLDTVNNIRQRLRSFINTKDLSVALTTRILSRIDAEIFNSSDIGDEDIILKDDTITAFENFISASDLTLNTAEEITFKELDKTEKIAMEASVLNEEVGEFFVNESIQDTGGVVEHSLTYKLTNLENDFVQRGQLRDNGTMKNNTVLAPESLYSIEYFDPLTLKTAVVSFTTTSSGSSFKIPGWGFDEGDDTDTDADGLTDQVEDILGLNSSSGDSDNDGISDIAELEQGLDPLGNRNFPTGIIASLPLQGEAKAVVVEGSTTNSGQQTAYIATGSHGLAIVDASRFDSPIILGQLDIPGDATDIAVDSSLQLAVVASNSGGVQIMDISDSMLPTLITTLDFNANQVEIMDGVAYITIGATLRAIDLLTGESLQRVTLPGSGVVTELVRNRSTLYAYVSGSNTLSAIDISDVQSLTVLGQTNVAIASSTVGLFATDDVVHIAGRGLHTVDVSDPTNPTLIASAGQSFTARNITLNGSGLGLVAENQGIAIYNVSDPTNTNNFITSENTPGFVQDIAIASGIAYVADGRGGLQVINYLPFDNRGQAPEITIRSPLDVDPDTPGVQVTEGSDIPVIADVSDDRQVRNVELLVNGEVVSNDVSFPFDLNAIALNNTPDATTVEVQARATDTGGNVALSNLLTFELVPDTFAPIIKHITPEENTESAQNLRRVEVRFNEAIDTTTVTAANFQLLDSNGTTIDPQDIRLRSGDRTVQLTYEPLPAGEYNLAIDASDVTDRAGNALGETDIINPFTLLEGTIFWVGGSGDWHDPTNWNTGVVPGADDSVVINAPGDATITFSSRSATIANLLIDDHLKIASGTLTVTNELEVEGGLTLSGGILGIDGLGVIEGDSSWTSGTITGDGSLTNVGTLNISGGFDKILSGTLNNEGVIIQNTSRRSLHLNNGILNNLAGAIYNFQTGHITRSSEIEGAINNSGTFHKTTEEHAFISADFNLTGGTLDAQQGTLQLSGNGTSTGGIFSAAEGGVIEYSHDGIRNFSGTYTGEGEGRVNFAGGTIQATEGETATFNLTGNLLHWTGGTIGNGLTNAGTLNISGGFEKILSGTLNNEGVIIQNTSRRSLHLNNGILNNLAGAIYNFQTGHITRSSEIEGAINNSGTFRKTTEEHAFISADFNLTGGTLDAQQGTLLLSGNGTSTGGIFSAAEGGVIEYSHDGIRNFSGTYTGEGEGRVNFAGGTIQATERETATFNLTGNLLHWTGGTIGNGLTNAGTLNISGGFEKILSGTLNNEGVIIQNTSRRSLHLNNGILNNLAGAIYNFQTGHITRSSEIEGAINNSGTFRKTTEEHAFISADFNLTGGTLDAQQGTLLLSGNGTSTGGIFSAAEGGVIEYSHGGIRNFSGTYTGEGEGRVNFAGGTIQATEGETATFNLTGNLLHWTGGTIGNGLTNAGTLNISGGFEKILSGTLNNEGVIIQNTSRRSLHLNNGILNNLAGAIYNFQTGHITRSSEIEGAINNSGTFRKTTEEYASISADFNLTEGTLDVQQGTLHFADNYTQTGGTVILSGGDLTSSQTLNINSGSITGSGTINASILNSGILAPGYTTPGTLILNGTYTQTSDGTLQIDLRGTTPDTQHDRLQINGTATLDGILDIHLIDDYEPVEGDRFDILTFSSATGNFNTINGLTLPSSLILDPLLESRTFSLTAT